MLQTNLGARILLRRTNSQRVGVICFKASGLHISHRWSAKKKSLKVFKLADIGEGITECEVLKWNVKPLARVEHFDQLCEVQSDKASVEITSPYDGVISEIHVQEGQIAKVGEGLCTIEVEEEEYGAPVQEEPQKTKAEETMAASHVVTKPVHPPNSASESVYSTPLASSPTTGVSPQPTRKKHPLDPEAASLPQSSSPKYDDKVERKTLATPSVRHFAREMGIPRLSQLYPGSGKDGRIEKSDVQAWISRSSATASSQTAPLQSSANALTSIPGVETTVQLGRTRWAMWRAMEQSLKIPHFGYSTTLDLTALHELLPSLNASIPPEFNPPATPKYPPAVSPHSVLAKGQPTLSSDPQAHYSRITFLPLLLKSLSRAMQEWPLFRSSISHPSNESQSIEKPSLIIRPNSDVAIALSTPTGLYTPVIQSINHKSGYEIMGELRRLSNLGRTVPHGLTPKEMPKKGATVTVSNVGAIGKGEFAAPLLVPGGGVAIVAIGRAKWVERGHGKRLEVGISWSADHRVVEGAEMAAFTETWRAWVEEPGRMAAAGR